MNSLLDQIKRLLVTVELEYAKQVMDLIDIGGPTGMRNSQASSMGLASNTVRAEFIERLKSIIANVEDFEGKLVNVRTVDGVRYEVYVSPSMADLPVNVLASDTAQLEERIMSGDTWAWCVITVRAITPDGMIGQVKQVQCSYHGLWEFLSLPIYQHLMKLALGEAKR